VKEFLIKDSRRRLPEAEVSRPPAVCPNETYAIRRLKPWQQKFLRSLRVTPDVTVAASKAIVSRQHAYRVRSEDPAFNEAWTAALDASVDAVEAKAFALAKAGDASLIQWLLRSHRPSTYRETTRQEHAVLGKIVLIPAKAAGDE